jgi:hypothetical protein
LFCILATNNDLASTLLSMTRDILVNGTRLLTAEILNLDPASVIDAMPSIIDGFTQIVDNFANTTTQQNQTNGISI